MREFANNYFQENFQGTGTFLWAYFESEQEASNQSKGTHIFVRDDAVGALIDEEFIDIFHYYTEQYWDSDLNDQQLIATVFTKTADRAMKKTVGLFDVLKVIVIAFAVVVVLVLLFIFIMLKWERDAQKAKETERILNTPLDDLDTTPPEMQELLDKYKPE
jgi:hypothetical protein